MQPIFSKDREAVLVAVGSNVSSGDLPPISVAERAVERLSACGVAATGVSRWYRTPAWPPGAGPDFVNAALRVEAGEGPENLLALLHRVESEFGRSRGVRWAARSLDLDLVAWGQMVLPDAATQTEWRGLPAERQREVAPDRLILPHPRLHDRPFVLIPLADVAPDWRHPLTGASVAGMVAALPANQVEEIRPI